MQKVIEKKSKLKKKFNDFLCKNTKASVRVEIQRIKILRHVRGKKY